MIETLDIEGKSVDRAFPVEMEVHINTTDSNMPEYYIEVKGKRVFLPDVPIGNLQVSCLERIVCYQRSLFKKAFLVRLYTPQELKMVREEPH